MERVWCVWAWTGDAVCDLHVRLPGRAGPSAYNHGCVCARSRCCPPVRCSPLQPNRELYEPPQQTDAHRSDIPAGNEKGKDGRKIHIRCCSLEVKGCRFIVVSCSKKSRGKKVSKWRVTGHRSGGEVRYTPLNCKVLIYLAGQKSADTCTMTHKTNKNVNISEKSIWIKKIIIVTTRKRNLS